jgi:hypothetical protein
MRSTQAWTYESNGDVAATFVLERSGLDRIDRKGDMRELGRETTYQPIRLGQQA